MIFVRICPLEGNFAGMHRYEDIFSRDCAVAKTIFATTFDLAVIFARISEIDVSFFAHVLRAADVKVFMAK